MDKFDKVCIVRQQILDHLNEAGQGNSRSVSQAVGISLDYAYQQMAAMCEYGEIEKRGRLKNVHFVPLRQITTSADMMRKLQEQNRAANKREDREREKERNKKREPWRYVHIVKADDPPLKNQGGQGATRHTSWSRSEGSAT